MGWVGVGLSSSSTAADDGDMMAASDIESRDERVTINPIPDLGKDVFVDDASGVISIKLQSTIRQIRSIARNGEATDR